MVRDDTLSHPEIKRGRAHMQLPSQAFDPDDVAMMGRICDEALSEAQRRLSLPLIVTKATCVALWLRGSWQPSSSANAIQSDLRRLRWMRWTRNPDLLSPNRTILRTPAVCDDRQTAARLSPREAAAPDAWEPTISPNVGRPWLSLCKPRLSSARWRLSPTKHAGRGAPWLETNLGILARRGIKKPHGSVLWGPLIAQHSTC